MWGVGVDQRVVAQRPRQGWRPNPCSGPGVPGASSECVSSTPCGPRVFPRERAGCTRKRLWLKGRLKFPALDRSACGMDCAKGDRRNGTDTAQVRQRRAFHHCIGIGTPAGCSPQSDRRRRKDPVSGTSKCRSGCHIQGLNRCKSPPALRDCWPQIRALPPCIGIESRKLKIPHEILAYSLSRLLFTSV
jgi:hypothetical protein